MLFSCEKSFLQSAVSTASRAVAAKSAVPSLEGLLLETQGERLVISGYDLKTGIRTSLPADVRSPGAVIINARLFGDIIRRLADDVITVSVDANLTANIRCGSSDFNISCMDASDYPELPSVDGQKQIAISQKIMKSMIGETNFAVSDNEARPIHTGSLFEIEKGSLTVVSVDGYRLALRREMLENLAGDSYSFVVPGTALSEVEKIASDSDEALKITLGAKHILFSIGETELISRRLEGEFLNYRNAVPASGKYEIEADRRALIDTVERVSLIISDKLKSPVRCTFSDGRLKVATTSVLGKASDECPVKGDGEELEIGFNNKYILDALKAAPADAVKLKLSSGVLPCVIAPADGSSGFLYMILPVRLKANEN